MTQNVTQIPSKNTKAYLHTPHTHFTYFKVASLFLPFSHFSFFPPPLAPASFLPKPGIPCPYAMHWMSKGNPL